MSLALAVRKLPHAAPRPVAVGAWFLFARGSGIWMNTGSSVVFGDHDEGYRHFNISDDVDKSDKNEAMVGAAARAGYDSIQFIRHTCSMMYDPCLNRTEPGLTYFNIEVVSTRLTGVYACASEFGDSSLLRTGWKGASKCTCSNATSDYRNCEEVRAGGMLARKPPKEMKMGAQNSTKVAA